MGPPVENGNDDAAVKPFRMTADPVPVPAWAKPGSVRFARYGVLRLDLA